MTDEEIRHYEEKWEGFYAREEALKRENESLRARVAELEKDRDAWKTRAGFLSIEGVPDSVCEGYFESDEECAEAIDDEMIKTGDHWGLIPHLEPRAAMKAGETGGEEDGS